MARYVNIDRDTPLLLPSDLREWVPAEHLCIVIDAVELIDTRTALGNERGTGSEQIPPGMLLALLVYSYATGMFSSRQIERASYENVAVRLLCADTHPDYDTLCTFRRKNGPLLTQAFKQILELSARCGVLQVGHITVAIDGTKILANASKHSAVSHGHAEQTLRTLDLKIADLMAEADQADATPLQDGLTISAEAQRRQERKAQLQRAKAAMEARAYARFQAEQIEHEATLARRAEAAAASGKAPRGRTPRAPEAGAAADRPSKLHRPRQRDHENQGRLPAGLQRPGRRRYRLAPDCRTTCQPSRQRQTRTARERRRRARTRIGGYVTDRQRLLSVKPP